MDLNDRRHRRQVLSLLEGPVSRVGEDVSERLNSTIDALLPWAYSPPAALKRRGLKTTLTLGRVDEFSGADIFGIPALNLA